MPKIITTSSAVVAAATAVGGVLAKILKSMSYIKTVPYHGVSYTARSFMI
jgi:hypothetical protein